MLLEKSKMSHVKKKKNYPKIMCELIKVYRLILIYTVYVTEYKRLSAI